MANKEEISARVFETEFHGKLLYTWTGMFLGVSADSQQQ